MPRTVIHFDGFVTITTTKGITDIVCSINLHISFGNNGRVTTAIDFFNTGIITTIDNHLTLLSISRHIIGLVTTTIY